MSLNQMKDESFLRFENECTQNLSINEFYENYLKIGVHYGPFFRGVKELKKGPGKVIARIEFSGEKSLAINGKYQIHPIVLDACFQICMALVDTDDTYLPLSIRSFKVKGVIEQRIWCCVEIKNLDQVNKRFVTDIGIYSESGQQLALIQGFTAVAAPKTSLMKNGGKKDKFESLMYEVNWKEQALKETAATSEKSYWVIFADDSGFSQKLGSYLEKLGDETFYVHHSHAHQDAPSHFFIDLKSEDAHENVLNKITESVTSNSVFKRSGNLAENLKIIHLWSLDFSEEKCLKNSSDWILEEQRYGYGSVLDLTKALLKKFKSKIPKTLVATKCTQATSIEDRTISIGHVPVWGLGRVIDLELPEISCIRVDLENSNEDSQVKFLVNEINAKTDERQIAFRGQKRFVARLERIASQQILPKALSGECVRLHHDSSGSLESLKFETLNRKPPGAGFVEIRVHASAVNFRDVLDVLGKIDYSDVMKIVGNYAAPKGELSGECSGEIVAVGEGVRDLKIGDRVLVTAASGISSYANANADLVARIPDHLHLVDAATIPISFLTAWYGFYHLAKIKKGERVFIHAAAGGLGIAAVQIAQLLGAEVYASASSPVKRALLESMGVKYTMNSRDMSFVNEINRLTNGEGVDVVLNSLSGEFIPNSLKILRQGGRFLEVGKVGIWTEKQAKEFNPKVSYSVIVVDKMIVDDTKTINSLLKELMERMENKQLRPIPAAIHRIQEAVNVFRLMAQGRHTGKLILTWPQSEIKPNVTYLITGGLGALGIKVMEWLASCGAKHFLLVGRKSPSAEAQKVIFHLSSSGTTIKIAQADISAPDVNKSIEAFLNDMPPLKGIVHAAGILDDGVIEEQTWKKFIGVAGAKISGGWNLYRLAEQKELDFFVGFSSTTASMGNAGQANYGGANIFLDGLSQYGRRHGMNITAVNWGPWKDAGMAANLGTRLLKMGMGSLGADESLLILHQILESPVPQVTVVLMNWSKYAETVNPKQVGTYFSSLVSVNVRNKKSESASGLIERIQKLPMGERKEATASFLKGLVLSTLGSSADTVSTRTGFRDLGMDSLMSLEFRNRMKTAFNFSFPASLVFDYPNLEVLSEYVLKEIIGLKNSEPTEIKAVKKTRRQSLSASEPIAIIGMGCRYPKSPDLESFWRLIQAGVNAVEHVPSARWVNSEFYDINPDATGKISTQFLGTLDGVENFDAQFFGISAHEAKFMDPEQRIFLETCWSALEDSGVVPEELYNSDTGVFVGASGHDYANLLLRNLKQDELDVFYSTGTVGSVLSGRTSYFFGFKGPSIMIDTACSSSLVAIHNACQSIRNGECETALAGGIGLILEPTATISFSKGRFLSPEGKCKTFDASADGYVRSDGCGVVVLKTLKAAVAAGDRICGVIRSSSLNQDGPSSSLTAPNGTAQAELIENCISLGGLEPKDICYIECHGTGTKLGDPIEVRALSQVFKGSHSEEDPLVIGSVKTNIGHTETAAGVAGIIKTILCFKNEIITPHLHFKNINPEIDLSLIPAVVPVHATKWPKGKKKIAGVSSFGFSGTNAHVILEEAPKLTEVTKSGAIERPVHVLALSGKNEGALKDLAAKYVEFFGSNEEVNLGDVCFTANAGRSHFDKRMAVVGRTVEEMKKRLESSAGGDEVAGVLLVQFLYEYWPYQY